MPACRVVIPGLALILLLAACGAATPSSGATSGPESSPTSETGAPTGTATPGRSEAPTASETPASTDSPAPTEVPTPTEVPSDPPETLEPEPTADSAAACSGSDANREFFEGIARAVDWPVLCGVLPRGWFVSQGSYRLANGGKLLISYKGPGGSTLALSEGAWCAAEDGCVPPGTTLGGASLGPLAGTLYETADGYAIHVAPGENPSWLMTTTGLDQATTLALAAKLAQVGG